jgi:hypothetical protein
MTKRWSNTLGLLAVAVVLVVAGCSAPLATDARTDSDPSALPVGDTHPPADRDRLGWENGYRYDADLDVTLEDGLTDREREAVLARTMARVEQLRGQEFESGVSIEVISRATYQNRSVDFGYGDADTQEVAWNEQVWEALFLVGEDQTVEAAFDATLSSSVGGYYAPGEDAIVVVSDAANPTIDRRTLAHELVHALQDQHATLDEWPAVQDAQLARQGVTEGEANYVQRLYERRCEGQWQCLPLPASERGGTRTGAFNDGVFLTLYQPYASGPDFIARVHEERGWAGVDDLYVTLPASTEQVIHPQKYPDERPANVTVPDRSSEAWSRFDLDRPVYDTVGEASIYAMFASNGVIEWSTSAERYSYRHPISEGWAGDALVPYNGSDGDGYVWQTRWDSVADAEAFASAYTRLLETHGSRHVEDDVYTLSDSSAFADAFRITRDGNTVTIVNAPTVADLSGVHAPRFENHSAATGA